MIRHIKTLCKKAVGSAGCTFGLFALCLLPVKAEADGSFIPVTITRRHYQTSSDAVCIPGTASIGHGRPGYEASAALGNKDGIQVTDTAFGPALQAQPLQDTLPVVKDTARYIGFFDIPPQPVKGRIWALSGATAAVYTNSLLVLNRFWYSGYSQRSFHTFNDAGEWLQMDKAGHVFSSYMLSKYSREIWRWTGLPRKQQIWICGLSGFAYQTVVELLDAHSEHWGWSWSDMAANTFGVALMMSQELAWNEQRFQLKFSSFPIRYKDPVLEARATDQFGNSLAERTLKDYNSQTYWLSLNLKSFMKESNLPRWLNIAVGYSAEGMYDDYANYWTDAEGTTHDYTHIRRTRQFFISPDIDLTKIRTRHKGVKVLFQVLNMIKIPAPALEVNGAGRLKVHALYF